MEVVSRPRVLILVTVFQPSIRLLVRQLDSISQQTLPDFECVVSIDGAQQSDIEQIGLILPDQRFRIHGDGFRRGLYAHVEFLIQKFCHDHEFVAIADQDDEWMPDRLSGQISCLKLSMYSMVTDDAFVVRPESRHLPRGNIDFLFDILGISDASKEFGVLTNFATGAGSLYRGTILKFAIPFPSQIGPQVHDHWLLLVSLLHGDCVIRNDQTWKYIQHDKNQIGVASINSPARRVLVVIKKLTSILKYKLVTRDDPVISQLIVNTKVLLDRSAGIQISPMLFDQLFLLRHSRSHLISISALKRSRLETLRLFLWWKRYKSKLEELNLNSF